ncbi:MAG: hypothetical protein JNL98_17325 [Bryobacterales bacterium]|nr:hypothetical protein [Bryobacterales bacterium]
MIEPRRWIPVWIAAVVLGSQLLVEPIIGLADNGDFANVTNPFSIFHGEPETPTPYFDYVVQRWGADSSRKPDIRLLTSEWLLVAPTILAVAYGASAPYDLRWTGASHLAVFLAALYWFYPVLARLPRPSQLVAWALFLFVFCDVSYFAYFNSMYVDTASLLFLLLGLIFYLRLVAGAGEAKQNAIVFVIVCGLFLFSKAQHALLAVVVVPFVLFDPHLKSLPSLRSRAISAAILGCLGIACLSYTPPEYKAYAAYNVIFADWLPKSSNPVQVLRDLGMSEALSAYAGKDAFHPQSAMRDGTLRPELGNVPSHRQLAGYYLKHPGTAVDMVRAALEASALQRPYGFSNFAYSAGKPRGAMSEAFTLWSGGKATFFRGNPWLYGSVIGALCLASLAITSRRYRTVFPAMSVFVAMLFVEFFVSALADCRETTRHLFLFQAMLDLLFVFVMCHAVAIRPVLPGNHKLAADRFQQHPAL